MDTKRAFLCAGLALVLGVAPVLADEGEAEEEQPEPAWKSNIGLSYVATSGNSDTNTFGFDLKFERRPEPWGFEFLANFNRAEDSGELTAERYFASARAKRTLSERWEFFAGLSGEKDQFAGFDLRGVVESGVTYHALLGPKHLLSFDGGLTWTDESRIEPEPPEPGFEPDVSYFGGVAGLKYEWKISDTASVYERLLFYPNFDESSDWRLSSDTGLQVSMTSLLAVKLGYELRYRNEPIGDAESTDATTKASLVFTF